MIEKFLSGLPYKLGEQIMFEYTKRLSDIRYLTSGKFDYYSPLKGDIETIQVLLAITIFYKRVISNFESATQFTSRVIFKGEATSIQLGTYELNKAEIFKMKKVVIEFRVLINHFSIPEYLFEYLETKEFLRKVKQYKNTLPIE